MSKSDAPADKPSATVRPRNILLGIDSPGAHHVYKTHAEAIVVIDGSDIIHRQDVEAVPIASWMDAVERHPGWDDRKYSEHSTLADVLAEQLERMEER